MDSYAGKSNQSRSRSNSRASSKGRSLLKKDAGNPARFKRPVFNDTFNVQNISKALNVSSNSLQNSKIKIEALKVESEYLDEKLENQEVKSGEKLLYLEKRKSKEEYVLEKNSFAAAHVHQLSV